MIRVRVAAVLAAVVVIGACSGVPAAENIDRSRPDRKTCDAFIAKHGGHFHTSGSNDNPKILTMTLPPSASPAAVEGLRQARDFYGGAVCTVFMRGSQLKAATSCRDGMGQFLVSADAKRFIAEDCFYG